MGGGGRGRWGVKGGRKRREKVGGEEGRKKKGEMEVREEGRGRNDGVRIGQRRRRVERD